MGGVPEVSSFVSQFCMDVMGGGGKVLRHRTEIWAEGSTKFGDELTSVTKVFFGKMF